MTEPTKSNETKPEGVPDPNTPENLMGGLVRADGIVVMAKAVDPETGMPRCTAHSKTSKKRCKQRPVAGTAVCVYHGGKAPQVRKKAALRLMELVDPAISTLAREMVNQQASPGDRMRAAENVLDRTGFARRVEVDAETAREQLQFRLEKLREERERAAAAGETPEG